MPISTVPAHLIGPGDVIRVEGQNGWYVVGNAFREGPGGPMNFDLLSEDDQSRYNWHVGPEYQVEQRI